MTGIAHLPRMSSFTVISHDALTPLPSLAVTVMVAVPGAMAVTLPALSTVAMLGLLLLQEMRLRSASSGVVVMVSVRLSPSVSVADDSLKVIRVIAASRLTMVPKSLHGALLLYSSIELAGTCSVSPTTTASKQTAP